MIYDDGKATLHLRDIDKAVSLLKNINWDFGVRRLTPPNRMFPFDCRKYHWYPATFIPEIPFTLEEMLTAPNAVVYDPFAGIGTTYFQSLLLERKPLATEVCQVATDYMKSLFHLFNPNCNYEKIQANVDEIARGYNEAHDYSTDISSSVKIERMKPWFSKNTLNQITYLIRKAEESEDTHTKSVLEIFLSANLKASSSQDRGWGCISDNVLPTKNQIKDKDVIRHFEARSTNLIGDIIKHMKFTSETYATFYESLSCEASIVHSDVRKADTIPNGVVDLIITSPPYPNMADYVTSQRLTYYWRGYEVDSSLEGSTNDFKGEIGARRKRFHKDSLDDYYKGMAESNKMMADKLKQGGIACLVLPDFSSDFQNNIDRKRIIQSVLSHLQQECNMIKLEEYKRVLPTKRRHHNQKWATLQREKIHLFQKV